MKERRNDNLNTYFCIVMSLVGLIAFFTFPHIITKISSIEETSAQVLPSVAQPKPDPFRGVLLQAKAAFVYDLSTNKVLYAKNAEAPLPLASITKLMTGITAIESAPTSTVITIQRDALSQDGDSGLYLGEQWNLVDLLKYTLVVSSNDGAYAIAQGLGSHLLDTTASSSVSQFVENMNLKAKQLGLENTQFFNPTGLDETTSLAGGYGSAHDVEKMLAYAELHHSDIFSSTHASTIQVTSLNGFTHVGQNTDILTDEIPNLIAGKTGNTDLAGGNLAVMFEPTLNHRIIIVVLGSTYDGRFSDMQKLVDAATTTIAY